MGGGAGRGRPQPKKGATRPGGRAPGFGTELTGIADVRRRYAAAITVREPPTAVRTLADMSEEEIAALERQLGAPVRGPRSQRLPDRS